MSKLHIRPEGGQVDDRDEGMNSLDELAQALTETLTETIEELLARGFKLPFHFAWFGLNGSLVAGTYRAADEGLTCELTAQHTVGAGFTVPINAMFVDADGEATRVVIGPDGQRSWAN